MLNLIFSKFSKNIKQHVEYTIYNNAHVIIYTSRDCVEVMGMDAFINRSMVIF